MELRVEGGNLVSASGDPGARLLEMLRGAGTGGTGVAELGIGTNEKAILTGNLIEDEKILGSATWHSAHRRASAASSRCPSTSTAW